MTLSPARKVAVAALVLVDGALLLLVVSLVVSLAPHVEPGALVTFLVLLAALLLPLVILLQSRGRRVLLAWGVFPATFLLAFGTCAALLARSGL